MNFWDVYFEPLISQHCYQVPARFWNSEKGVAVLASVIQFHDGSKAALSSMGKKEPRVVNLKNNGRMMTILRVVVLCWSEQKIIAVFIASKSPVSVQPQQPNKIPNKR